MEAKRPRLSSWGIPAGLAVTAAAAIIIMIVTIVVTVSKGSDPPPSLVTAPGDTQEDGVPYPDVERIPLIDAHALAQSGEALIVDVRDQSEYLAQHVAGSLGLPEGELATRLDELPRDSLIITYCA